MTSSAELSRQRVQVDRDFRVSAQGCTWSPTGSLSQAGETAQCGIPKGQNMRSVAVVRFLGKACDK